MCRVRSVSRRKVKTSILKEDVIMRVTYHVYYLKSKANGELYKFDIADVLDTLLDEDITFKKGFLLEDEFLYIVKENPQKAPTTFFFIITRDNELIKAIDNNLSVRDIRDKLDKANEEKIGVGSFVHITTKNNCPLVAFSTQLLSPRIDLFWNFVNEYLNKKGLSDKYEIIGHPVTAKAEVSELMKMDIVGKTSMVLNTHHGMAHAFKEFFGKEMSFDGIGTFEITITPKKGQNIKKAMPDLVKIAEDPGTVKLTSKAKGEAYSALTELFIVGSGSLGDEISPAERTTLKVKDAIGNKIRDNVALGKKLTEFYEDAGFSEEQIPITFMQAFAGVTGDDKGGKS